VVMITEEVRAHAREQANGRCECQGANCRHHRAGARCKRGLRGDQWKVHWRSESGGLARGDIDAWCLVCFENNFTIPTDTVTILRSEIFGYAGFASDDQRKAVTLMSVFRDAADLVASENQGRLVRTSSDEVWLEFTKSPHAVDAARELQRRFHENASKLNLPTPALCCGIHRGEVTRSRSGDLFGETLTIASQVRGIAEEGQIVVSGSVVDQLGKGIELEDLGDRNLEDLTEPLRCWAVRP